ncbi:DMT family transporter [Alkalibacillus salilacus]|uniref:DME family drug/metabolite transporter n=1 Tax=Alkalibacillus salilacus TaxID=284582 RepID=A0ABT9VEK1_9BACI|nr:EamA family transporter [Alkalibacillus salilacus]MDQ0159290.1 DME family drug/metabolite transporter [Alkalibacillus salilacus]
MRYMMLVLAGAILWGTTGTAQALAPNESSPLVVGALRLLIGGGSLFILISLQKRFSFRHLPKKPILISAIAMALYQPFFFSGVAMTGVAVGTVIAICSAPIIAGLFEAIKFRSMPERLWVIATALAILGCVLLFSASEKVAFDPRGMVLALLAGVAFAIYTLTSKQLVTSYRSDTVVAVVFSTAALFLLPILVVSDLAWVFEPMGLVTMLHLGLLATALAYLLFAAGLKGVTASAAVTLALAEPLTAAMLGFIWLGEPLNFVSGFGILLLLGAILLLTLKPSNQASTS